VTDDPASTLAEIRAIEQAATPGPWQAVRGTWGENETFPAVITSHGDPAKAETWLMAAGRGSPDPESNAKFAAMARTTIPALLAAAGKVLELHQPVDRGRVMRCCEGCEKINGEFHEDCCHEWPCPAVEAITAELTGKEAG
jgi:hypothetical protein